MRARAGALDELLESGALEDMTQTGDAIDRELSQVAAESEVNAELEALKRELGTGSTPAEGTAIEGGQS
jgi:phage shock protein A